MADNGAWRVENGSSSASSILAPVLSPAQVMPESAAPNAELLSSLGRLVRGLSALFWGLPIALVVCVQTAKGDWFEIFGVVPPLAVMTLLFYVYVLLYQCSLLDTTNVLLSHLLVLLPVATTMALIWKTKEIIQASVFAPET